MTSERVLFGGRLRARALPGSHARARVSEQESVGDGREAEDPGFFSSSYRDSVFERDALQRFSVSHPVLGVAFPERRRHAGRAAVRARFGTRQTEPQLALRVRTGAAPRRHRGEILLRHLPLSSPLVCSVTGCARAAASHLTSPPEDEARAPARDHKSKQNRLKR